MSNPMETANFVENDDGSVDIVGQDEPQPSQGEFDQNLVEQFSQSELQGIATDLVELIELDKESRKKRDEQYAEGLRRTGLSDESPQAASFPGASTVVHPVLAEACIDYSASVMKEIFPPDGPVKTKFRSSNPDPSQTERAENKRDFYNWQLTTQMPEYRNNLEVLSVQQPLGGSQFLKFWYDEGKKRPFCEFIPIDQVYLPFSATSFQGANRATIALKLTRHEFERRVKSKMYVSPNTLIAPAFLPEQSVTEKVNEGIEGVSEEAYNEDGLRLLYEVYVDYDLEEEENLPYIITIDEYTNTIVSIYRNWEEDDLSHEKLEWVIEFPFIPWRGAYGIGLYHLIGGLTASATGALRALLDSAHINNFPGAVRLKGPGRTSGANVQLNPTEIVEIEGVTGVDDIRKTVMGLPFNPPSPVLFQLLGFVVDAAKGVVSVAEEKISDASNQMPVGTVLALIEQGSKVFSSIHARQHLAQERVLKVLNRLNYQNFDPQAQMKAFGRVLVTQQEFKLDNNIAPVSDPNIYSEAQRYAQIQGVLQLSADPTVQWNKVAIYRKLLSVMHIDNPDEYLLPIPQPVSADPVTEIVAAMSGQPIKAMPDMDHLAHINEELSYLLDPVFGGANPTIISPGLQAIMADINHHMLLLFQGMKQMSQQNAMMAVEQQLSQMMMQGGTPQELVPMLIQQMMISPQGKSQVQQQAQQLFEQAKVSVTPLVEKIAQADQLVKQKTPPPPIPPEVQAQVQIAQLRESRQEKLDQATIQLKSQSQQLDQQREQMELGMAQNQQQFDNFMSVQQQKLQQVADTMTQQMALQKNEDDNRQHQMTELLKNHEDNQTNLMMEQMRQEGLQNRHEMEVSFKEQQAKLDTLMSAVITMSSQQVKPNGEGEGKSKDNEESKKSSESITEIMGQMTKMITELQRPKQIVRDENNRIIGVR